MKYITLSFTVAITTFLSLSVLFVLSGCATFMAPDTNGIEAGMSQKQVRDIMGKPTRFSSYGCGQAYSSCNVRLTYGKYPNKQVIRLINGRVTGY